MSDYKPWIAHYDQGVPPRIEYPNIGIPSLLQNSAVKHPERIALIQGQKRITYSNLYKKACNLAKVFVVNGLRTGDRVAICLSNQIEFVIAFYATLLAGGVVAALNPTYPVREMKFQVEIAKTKFLIGSNKGIGKIQELDNESYFDLVFLSTGDNEFSFECYKHDKKTKIQSNTELENANLPAIEPDDQAILQFSGGTTGVPKAATGLHRNVVANVRQFSTWLTGLQEGKEVFLTAIPLFHVYGMVIGLNVGIALGASIVLIEDAKDTGFLIETISKEQVSVFPGVPTLFNSICQYCETEIPGSNFSSLKVCISGSAPLSKTVKDKFEKLTGARLAEGYGLSEAPTATHCNPVMGKNKEVSIGLPLPDVDCRIVDLEERSNSVRVGQSGELLIKGPQVMQGYFEKEGETRLTIESGWLHTGDIAYMDEDGYFFIIGRLKELIKVGGLQVWPTEIEEVIRQLPGINECAVKGIPDELLGEVAKVWVVINTEYLVDLRSVREFCEGKLANYKIPREMEIITELPRSAIGKVLRYKL